MANSKVTYTAGSTGAGQTFAVTFSFINRSHVDVEVNGTSAAFTWNSNSEVAVTGTVTTGDTVLIIRVSSLTTRLVDYVDGSNLSETDLDTDSLQAFYLSQEAVDAFGAFDTGLVATDAHILVGDGTEFNNVLMSGDATLANTGALTIATDAVEPAMIAADAVTTVKVLDANITLAKMAPTSASNKLIGRVASGAGVLEEVTLQTTLSSTDEAVPTSKAVRDDIVALVNAVGGFVAIASEVAFPNDNPDPEDGAGTVVSIANAGGVVVNSSGVSTTGRTIGSDTVTITGIPATYQSTTIADGLGMQVISTTTLNTYTYHKIAAKEGDTNIVATNIANVNSVAGNDADITTVAGQISPTNNIQTIATNNANITAVGGDIANVNTVAGNGTNINIVAGDITNVNTTATNIASVNSFAEVYRIAGADPTTSLTEGDLVFRTDSNAMRVYNGSAWQNVSPTSTAMAFGTVVVAGQSDVVADSTSDTMTLVGSGGTSITTNAGTDTVTVSSTAGASVGLVLALG
tara:strand:- start:2845 stop:4401 length:1557 start_codon:yes stop_codon:yes gene_type:complete